MEKILLAYDGTEPSKRALATAARMARALDARLGVVSVVPRGLGPYPEDSLDDADVHSRELLEARDLLRSEGLEAELFQPAGDPATMIEEIAESGAFGMVIVGTRGLGAFSAFFGDSVSEHVATHAYSTVLVAR